MDHVRFDRVFQSPSLMYPPLGGLNIHSTAQRLYPRRREFPRRCRDLDRIDIEAIGLIAFLTLSLRERVYLNGLFSTSQFVAELSIFSDACSG